jgi:hypothetical protein
MPGRDTVCVEQRTRGCIHWLGGVSRVDIFREGDPVALLGTGWFALESFKGDSFRWVSNDAKLHVARLRSCAYTVSLTLEPGPGLGSKPFDLSVRDDGSRELATLKIQGKQTVSFELPAGEPSVHKLTLHVDGGGRTALGDDRILNFRVFNITMAPGASDIILSNLGLKLGSGWYPIENFNGETFRWVGNEAIVEAQDPGKAKVVRLDVEPGPGVGFAPFKLSVATNDSAQASVIEISGRQEIAIPLPKTHEASKVRLKVEGGGKAVPGDARILNFRAFALVD